MSDNASAGENRDAAPAPQSITYRFDLIQPVTEQDVDDALAEVREALIAETRR